MAPLPLGEHDSLGLPTMNIAVESSGFDLVISG